MRGTRYQGLAILTVVTMLVGCGGSSPSSATRSSADASPIVSPSSMVPSPVPSSLVAPSTPASAAPSGTPGGLEVGALAVTVVDRLRVRSEPRVSADSKKYGPVLPVGTGLRIVGGPVEASGYEWYQVELVDFLLNDGITRGWVALSDHDGTPWIAQADAPIPALDVKQSSVGRAPADPADALTAATSINAFAVDLYRRLLKDKALDLADKNDVFSPASIALALGMVRGGARGETATQMDDVLHTAGWDALSRGLNALDQALASRDQTWNDYDGAAHQVALRTANTTFAQRDWSIEQDFLDAIAEAFGAGVNLVDYASNPEAARAAINAWVKRQTAGRIPELLSPPDVTTLTRLYLVNAIYLKAEWESRFDRAATKDRTFTRLDGSTTKVPTMAMYGGPLGPYLPYAHGDGWRATELRYLAKSENDPQLAMTIIEPDHIAAFEKGLTPKLIGRIVAAIDKERAHMFDHECGIDGPGSCYSYDLDLYLPKFSIETRANLKKVLGALGMPAAFIQADADFTGIHVPSDPIDNIYISAVIHQANIDIDEQGTEAAAATAVGVDTGGGPSALDKITFRVDHPFLYVLRDVETGAILFMGRVVDPSVGR